MTSMASLKFPGQAYPLNARNRLECISRKTTLSLRLSIPRPGKYCHVRMLKPKGRSDDMMIVKGVNVWPSQIETVLLNQGYQANYQIIVDRIGNNDTIEVQVELTPEMAENPTLPIPTREKKIVSALRSMLGITVNVKVVEPKSITRSEGKAVRVIDKRHLYQ